MKKRNELAVAMVFAWSCAPPQPELATTRVATIPPAIAPQSATALTPNASLPALSSAPSATPPPDVAPGAPDERVVAKSGRVAFTQKGELWVTDERGANARRLVSPKGLMLQNTDANLPGLDSSDIASLSFSPDEKRIYFLESGWATSMALFYAEVDSGKVFLFHDANGYSVVRECRDKKQIGRVITFEHSYFDINPMSASDYFFLVGSEEPKPKEERTGRSGRVGIIGPDQDNVDRFLAKTCGVGKAKTEKTAKLPANLTAQPIKCGNLKLKRADLPLLDGTKVIRFASNEGGNDEQILPLEDALELCKPKSD